MKQMMMMDVLVVHVEVIEAMWWRFMCSSYKKKPEIWERNKDRDEDEETEKKQCVDVWLSSGHKLFLKYNNSYMNIFIL